MKCTGCGADVDQLTDAADPKCSSCCPRAVIAPAAAEAASMSRVADAMSAEAAQLLAAVPGSAIAAELEQWATRLAGAAVLRAGAF